MADRESAHECRIAPSTSVSIPIPHAFTHRVRAVEKLHEAHSALDEAAREQTIPRKPGLVFIAVVHATYSSVALLSWLNSPISAALSDLRRQLVTGNAREQLAVARMPGEVPVVEKFQEVARARLRGRRNRFSGVSRLGIGLSALNAVP
jgi:hypothetical protein